MRLVKDDEVPIRGLFEFLKSILQLERIDAPDQQVMLGKGGGAAVADVALTPKDLEVEVEDLIQFAVPVIHQTCGNNHQRPNHLASARQLAKHQGGLDGLPEPDFIRNQEATRRGHRDSMHEHHLMRKQVDLRRGQAGGAFEKRQLVGEEAQPRLLVALRIAPGVTDDRLVAVEDEGQRRLRNLSLTGSEKAADKPSRNEADDHAFAEVAMSNSRSGRDLSGCFHAHETLCRK